MAALQIAWASAKATYGSSRLTYTQFIKVCVCVQRLAAVGIGAYTAGMRTLLLVADAAACEVNMQIDADPFPCGGAV